MLGPRLRFAGIAVRYLRFANVRITRANCHSWYKLLPKKGPVFDSVMEHLRYVGMEQWSADYAFIRDAIVQSRMDLLRGVENRAPMAQTPQLPTNELMSPGSVYREARIEMFGLDR